MARRVGAGLFRDKKTGIHAVVDDLHGHVQQAVPGAVSHKLAHSYRALGLAQYAALVGRYPPAVVSSAQWAFVGAGTRMMHGVVDGGYHRQAAWDEARVQPSVDVCHRGPGRWLGYGDCPGRIFGAQW